MSLTLSKRLRRIAGLVVRGSRVADVGTDHGYIPVWLVQNGVCERVIASDVREEPLKNAMSSARREGVFDRIDFVLAPGLEKCSPDDADTVILAGMGGETIMDILTASPWALGKTLILQPQTKICELRAWLNEHGCDVADACLVDDTGRIYVVWKTAPGGGRALPPEELYIDRRLVEKRDPLLPVLLESLIKKTTEKIHGLERSSRPQDGELARSREILAGFNRMKEESEHGKG